MIHGHVAATRSQHVDGKCKRGHGAATRIPWEGSAQHTRDWGDAAANPRYISLCVNMFAIFMSLGHEAGTLRSDMTSILLKHGISHQKLLSSQWYQKPKFQASVLLQEIIEWLNLLRKTKGKLRINLRNTCQGRGLSKRLSPFLIFWSNGRLPMFGFHIILFC